MTATLYYIHDPMCSWCWAFRPVWKEIQSALPSNLTVEIVLGGLAPDSNDPMPLEMQQFLQQTWKKIQSAVPGTEFNFDFWTNCQPRRSTYPSCRAVIAAKKQNPAVESDMISAIQHAYYMEAKNPSDSETLVALASKLGLDAEQFKIDLDADETQQELLRQINFHQHLGAQGFPSLIVASNGQNHYVPTNYTNADFSINAIKALL